MDSLTRLPFCGAKATRSTAQTLATQVLVPISFTATSFDEGSWYSGSNPTRLTVPASAHGRQILLIGALDFTGSTNGTARTASFELNGSTTLVEDVRPVLGTIHVGITLSLVVTGTSGDYYEFSGYHNSNTGVTLDTRVSSFITSFSAVVL